MITLMAADTAPILVVDDDPKIVTLVRTYLERERYPVVTAADGHAALRAIEKHHPRLVVLDLMLPGLDGLELARLLRRDPLTASVPIVMLTARGEEIDRVLAAYPWLTDDEFVLEHLDRWLD